MAKNDSTSDDTSIDLVGANAKELLKSRIQQIANIEDEVDDLKEDIKQLKTELKSAGFASKTVNQLVKLFRSPEQVNTFAEELNLLLIYADAVDLKGGSGDGEIRARLRDLIDS